SLPNTCEDDFDRPILLLWPKGSLIIGVENEGAPRIDGKRIEDALVVLACDYTGLATFSLDETNGGAEPRRSSRAWWPFRSRRSLIAPFTFLGYRVLDEFVASVVGVRVRIVGSREEQTPASMHITALPESCDILRFCVRRP